LALWGWRRSGISYPVSCGVVDEESPKWYTLQYFKPGHRQRFFNWQILYDVFPLLFYIELIRGGNGGQNTSGDIVLCSEGLFVIKYIHSTIQNNATPPSYLILVLIFFCLAQDSYRIHKRLKAILPETHLNPKHLTQGMQ